MIIRSTKELEDVSKKNHREMQYKERRKDRLKVAGVDDLHVSFDTLQIREYPIILGDNPYVTQGPPLQIDWDHDYEENWNVDQYEETRPERRTFLEMVMPLEVRVQILQRNGESTKSINKRVREVQAMKIQRAETKELHLIGRTKTHERMELLGRGLRNFFTDKKKKEKELLERTKGLGEIIDEEDELPDTEF